MPYCPAIIHEHFRDPDSVRIEIMLKLLDRSPVVVDARRSNDPGLYHYSRYHGWLGFYRNMYTLLFCRVLYRNNSRGIAHPTAYIYQYSLSRMNSGSRLGARFALKISVHLVQTFWSSATKLPGSASALWYYGLGRDIFFVCFTSCFFSRNTVKTRVRFI